MFFFFLADRGAKYFYSLVKSLSRLLSSFCHLKGYSDLTYGHKRSLVSPNINVLQVILRITRKPLESFLQNRPSHSRGFILSTYINNPGSHPARISGDSCTKIDSVSVCPTIKQRTSFYNTKWTTQNWSGLMNLFLLYQAKVAWDSFWTQDPCLLQGKGTVIKLSLDLGSLERRTITESSYSKS